jgi:ligand-binding sensor domain-containing protein
VDDASAFAGCFGWGVSERVSVDYWTTYGTYHGLRSLDARAIFKGGDRLLRVGVGNDVGKGTLPNGMSWVSLANDHPELSFPASAYVSAFEEDSSGDVWMAIMDSSGGSGGGLVEVTRDDAWTVFRTSDGLPSNEVVTAQWQPPDTLWVGTLGGLARMAGGSWSSYTTSNSGLPDNRVRAIAAGPDGTVWIGTAGGGLAAFRDGEWRAFDRTNSDLPDNYVFSLAVAESGDLWISMGTGLALFRAEDQSP